MPSVFIRRQSSRFLDQDAARASLRACAQQLARECEAVRAVHLFGSLATGRATPRSDADVCVEITSDDDEARVHDRAISVFAEAPLPVDLFLKPSDALASDAGVAGAIAREGQRLA